MTDASLGALQMDVSVSILSEKIKEDLIPASKVSFQKIDCSHLSVGPLGAF